MNTTEITPLILTFNEAPNIRRTLEKLGWAKETLVVDSFSTDETLAITRQFPQVRVVQRKFDSFANQCNFGLKQIKTEWVLSLDADYILSDELNLELAALKPASDVSGYRAHFTYCIHGRKLRASLYPPRTVLYRKEKAHYHDEGHGHRVHVAGDVQTLKSVIYHDDRKATERWFGEQIKYAGQEAAHLMGTPNQQLKSVDRIRKKIILAPVLVFFYTLFIKRLILDGWPGWYYVFQRTLAEIILSLRLMEKEIEDNSKVERLKR